MKYDYLRIPPDDDEPWIRRPVLSVVITGPRRAIEGLALIDSGADWSLFSLELGEAVGPDFENAKRKTVEGIEGISTVGYELDIQIEVVKI